MNRRAWALVLAWALAGATGVRADGAKTAPTPFYRKYLVAGNRLDDQILEQEKRVEASPADASLRNDFGNLLAQRHFPKEAAQQYQIAADLDKANFISYYNLGLVLESEGKFSQAESAYQSSISRKHGFPQAHFRLGHLYEQAGNTSAAVEEYAHAMRIDPALRDPRRNPLVVDSELMYQASLENYRRDLAAASFKTESMFVEENRFRAMPVDRALSSKEAAGPEEAEPESEPRQVGTADAAGSGTSAQSSGAPGAPRRTAPRATSPDNPANPMLGRPRNINTSRPKTPQPTAPTGGAAAAAPPPPAALAPPGEPGTPPESMPEPTPTAPEEVEPS